MTSVTVKIMRISFFTQHNYFIATDVHINSTADFSCFNHVVFINPFNMDNHVSPKTFTNCGFFGIWFTMLELKNREKQKQRNGKSIRCMQSCGLCWKLSIYFNHANPVKCLNTFRITFYICEVYAKMLMWNVGELQWLNLCPPLT